MTRFSTALASFTAVALSAGGAMAAGTTLDAINMANIKLRLDGELKEWPGKMDSLSHAVQGSAGGESAAGQIGYDDQYLYVAFKVSDKQLVRTSGYGASEDHGSLLIAFPSGKGGYTNYELLLFQGDPGKVAGSVRTKGGAVKGAQLVEAPAKNGYTFEAKIPWSAMPQSASVRVGMRAVLRYTDSDSPGSVKSVLATGTGSGGGSLPRLRLENEQGLSASLLKQKGLSETAAREAYGDINGDKMLERVAVYGGFLTIVGPHYRGGDQFYFGELGVADASMVTNLILRDFDGDGKDEILIQKRVGAPEKYREILQVMKIGTDDAPWAAFSHEVAIVTEKGKIENDVSVAMKGKLPAITVAQGKADGFEPDSYAEPLSGDMPSALLPWESVKSRTFQWDGKAFSKVDEATGTPSLKSGGKKAAKKPAGPPPPPPPRPPTADEMLDRLYALYRKDRKVGTKPPRFDFVTDVAGNTDTERVLVHDRDIVVFGKGYRGGTTYSFITIGVADPKDVLDVTARDLTGDGKAEIVVRALLHAKASKELGGDVVDRYALFVYQVTESAIRRVFAAETGRALKENRVLGTIAFVPEKSGVRIELKPGRAVGWTEKSYPFPTDTTAAGGLEPLLLPWAGSSSRK
ncbi:MAG: sugar-binding protein, partial [Polyangiaceae bacterium]